MDWSNWAPLDSEPYEPSPEMHTIARWKVYSYTGAFAAQVSPDTWYYTDTGEVAMQWGDGTGMRARLSSSPSRCAGAANS
ncbi:hypothetical protein ACX8Z9_04660 [Arthrobacter halodurans]|uniref:Uncharacterized protein n=1 Tax=Arthrobacter halodurans TaxID=516699 RepID=A0ABV4UPW1_9MICC